MGVRVSKSFKVAPGVRFRVNAKSTSISFGGKGMRYTVNSKGQRTATVGVPGTATRTCATRTLPARTFATRTCAARTSPARS